MGDERLGLFGGEDDDRPRAPEPSGSDDDPPAPPMSVDQRALNIVGIEQARLALTAGRAAARRQPHPHQQPKQRPAGADTGLHQKVQAVRRTCLRRSRD